MHPQCVLLTDMFDVKDDFQIEEPPARPDIVPIFLGLFLLVLAFFIMLVSISTFEEVKSSKVMDSLTSTFTTVLPPTSDPVDFNAKDGDILAGEAFQEQVTSIFSTAIQVEKIEVVQPGRLMRLQMRVNVLYLDGQTTVREDQYPLLDRIVAVLSNRPPGLRQDMEVIIGSRVTDGVALPVGQTLEMSRVGELARLMVSRGAPPDAISIGMKPGDPNEISLWFWVRGVQETAVRFEEAMEAAKNRPAPEPEPLILRTQGQ